MKLAFVSPEGASRYAAPLGWFGLSRRSRATSWGGGSAPYRSLSGGSRTESRPRTPGSDGAADGEPPPSLDDLYRARRLDMVRLAVFLVDDQHTAEDVVQDAFTAVCRRHGTTLSELENAAAYLHTAVVNAARSVLRRRRTSRAYTSPHEADQASLDEAILLAEEHREVLAALRKLTVRQREVLVLRYWSGMTETEIAHTLGLSRGAVKSTASRALKALERLLEDTR